MIDPVPALFGLLVGFLVGLTGVGGGSLMTPFLVAVMQVPAPTAVGTDLVYATITKLTGSVQHYRQRSVNLEVAIFLGLGSIPASLLGVWTLEWIKESFDAGMVQSIMVTIIAHAMVLSFVTGFAHILNGNVDFTLAGTLLLGSIPGVLIGSRMAPRLPGRPLTIILAVMLVFVGARLLLS